MSRTRLTAEVRAADVGGTPGVTLHIIRPGLVDDYGTVWAADAFDESLRTRLPTLVWAHDRREPLGPAVGFRTGPDGPEVDFTFSDFEAVPAARRAHAQVADGTIRECSVGFWGVDRRTPTDEERIQWPGVVEIIERAELDEVSLVLRGAVPGAVVVGVRSGGVPIDAVIELARRQQLGEITVEEGRAALELLGADTDTESDAGAGDVEEAASSGAYFSSPGVHQVSGEVEPLPAVDPLDDLDVDAAIALATQRSRRIR